MNVLPRLRHALAAARERKLTRTLTLYTSISLTALGVVNLFLTHYNLPPRIFDILLVVLVCGLPAALLAAWNHAGGGTRPLRRSEGTVYAALLLLAIAGSVYVAGVPESHPRPSGGKSIAVLPFANLGQKDEDGYLSDGVTEDIITQLSKIADLRVISRTSVMQYRNTTKSLRDIGRELDVAAILEGSVRRAADRVRIVGQLIDARTDEHLWANTYDRQMTDIFAIQSDVALRIAEELRAQLLPEEKERIEKPSTGNIDAYTYYLRGRDYYYRYSNEGNENAIALFRKALSMDPRYALAYAGLGDALSRKSDYDDTGAWLDSAVSASQTAIGLDPGLAEGYKALGVACESQGDYGKALENYYRAARLNPSYAPAVSNIGSVHYQQGQYDRALTWMRKAASLQPGFARWSSNVGLQYFSLGEDSLATVWFRKALDLQPEFFFPSIVLAYIDLYAGRLDLARARMDTVARAHRDVYAVLDAAGDIELLDGKYTRAQACYEKAVARQSLNGPSGTKLAFVLTKLKQTRRARGILNGNVAAYAGSSNPNAIYASAEAYAVLDSTDQATDAFQRAIDSGYRSYRWASVDPLLDGIRQDPRFAKSMAQLQSSIDAMRRNVREEGLEQ